MSYGYDALGRRISRSRQSAGQTHETQWVLDTARPYSEIVLERTRQNGGAWKERAYVHTPDGVGLQISESEEGQIRHIYTDAQGSTRLITDEAGNVLQTLDYDAFGNEQGSGPTRHRYTGESFDEETGLYHLRARDYDPSTGRFISMDEHPGSRTIPLTLNKYLYGNADPVNHVDPSGNMSLAGTMSEVSGMAQMAAMSFIRMEIADFFTNLLLSPIIESAIHYTTHNINTPTFGHPGMATLLTVWAEQCYITKKKCYLKFPTIVNGLQTFNTSQHIWDALHGNGNTLSDVSKPLPFLLLRGPSNRKNEVSSSVRNATRHCNKRARTSVFEADGSVFKTVCDEYPYGSTLQGGDINYFLDGVSLRLVPLAEGGMQGGILSSFYSYARVNTVGKPFLSLASPYMPGFFINKHGKVK